MAEIKVGYSLFVKPWVQAPSSTIRRDGLGPHFSAVSCMSCHRGMGRGAPQGIIHDNDPSVVFRPVINKHKDLYGAQITPKALPGVKSEGWVRKSHQNDNSYFLDGEIIEVAARVAPHLAGLGQLEKIPDSEILENQKNGGIVSYVNGRVGRFSWKGEHPRLIDQVAAAFSFDMGITSFLFPNENCESHDFECHNKINGADEEGVEIRRDHLGMVVKLLASIQAPKVRYQNTRSERGREIFAAVNCTSCHRPNYNLSNGQEIQPYTDLLLHDMGEELADPEGVVKRQFWRTAPLWGIGSQKLVNGHTRYLHDGRADGLEQAIAWHGGEAKKVRESFLKLSKKDKEDLLYFLNSL